MMRSGLGLSLLCTCVLSVSVAWAFPPLKPQVESAVCSWTANGIDWKVTLFSYLTYDTPDTPEVAMIDADDHGENKRRIMTHTEHVVLSPSVDSFEIKMGAGEWSNEVRMRMEVSSQRGAQERAKLIISKRGQPTKEVDCQFVFMANANAKVDYDKVY